MGFSVDFFPFGGDGALRRERPHSGIISFNLENGMKRITTLILAILVVSTVGYCRKEDFRQPDVVWVPTPHEVVNKMLEMAQLKSTDVLFDLGCGDGRVVVAAAKNFGVRAFGFDIDPERIRDSKENVRNNNLENLVTIQQADIFTLDLSQANVITLYLLPSLNVKLIPQLLRCRPGTRIVSHDFDMQGVRPKQVYEMGGHTVYLWETPLQMEK